MSRVLNDRPDVSPENRRKVLSAIQQSNYIPNNTARDLVKTKSDAIGLVVRGVSNPFYTDIIRVIEEQVTARGYTLVMQQIGTCVRRGEAGRHDGAGKAAAGPDFVGRPVRLFAPGAGAR